LNFNFFYDIINFVEEENKYDHYRLCQDRKNDSCRQYPQQFTDFVCMPYKYILTKTEDYGEAGKANPDNIMRDD